MPDEYLLEKSVWTEEDFERMGWHDATVHAFAYEPDLSEFVLDLDYILKWIRPVEDETHLSFWSAPATLVFENVSRLAIELAPFPGFEISDIDRVNAQPAEGHERVLGSSEWHWTLGFFNGQISFRSTGYTQFIRRTPIPNTTQSLTLEERGGISFARPTEI
jgi:hypothetical protein